MTSWRQPLTSGFNALRNGLKKKFGKMKHKTTPFIYIGVNHTCVAPYSPATEDQTAFAPHRRGCTLADAGTMSVADLPFNCTGPPLGPWVYSVNASEHGEFYSPLGNQYPPPGFSTVLSPNNASQAKMQILELAANGFIDRQTRVVWLDMHLFNPTLDTLCDARISLEFPVSGGVYAHCSSYVVQTTQLDGDPWTLPLMQVEVLIYLLFFILDKVYLWQVCRGKLLSHGVVARVLISSVPCARSYFVGTVRAFLFRLFLFRPGVWCPVPAGSGVWCAFCGSRRSTGTSSARFCRGAAPWTARRGQRAAATSSAAGAAASGTARPAARSAGT